ncbi:hypothetical protein LRP88_14917 [Fusarium phalaenopsidis]
MGDSLLLLLPGNSHSSRGPVGRVILLGWGGSLSHNVSAHAGISVLRRHRQWYGSHSPVPVVVFCILGLPPVCCLPCRAVHASFGWGIRVASIVAVLQLFTGVFQNTSHFCFVQVVQIPNHILVHPAGNACQYLSVPEISIDCKGRVDPQISESRLKIVCFVGLVITVASIICFVGLVIIVASIIVALLPVLPAVVGVNAAGDYDKDERIPISEQILISGQILIVHL